MLVDISAKRYNKTIRNINTFEWYLQNYGIKASNAILRNAWTKLDYRKVELHACGHDQTYVNAFDFIRLCVGQYF